MVMPVAPMPLDGDVNVYQEDHLGTQAVRSAVARRSLPAHPQLHPGRAVVHDALAVLPDRDRIPRHPALRTDVYRIIKQGADRKRIERAHGMNRVSIDLEYMRRDFRRDGIGPEDISSVC